MKKVLGIVICFMMLSTVALASPLMDYSSGKGSIDLTWRNTQDNGPMANGLTGNLENGKDYERKGNLDAALTLGLGNNWGFQYRNFEPKSDDHVFNNALGIPGATVTQNLKFETNEFNVLYKLDKNVALLAGYMTTKATLSASTNSALIVFPFGSTLSDSKNMWQVGLLASTEIAPKTTLWGSFAAGNNSLTNWEVGVGYQFSPGWEFNVNYREIKTSVESVDFKDSGLGFGVTYKF
jgi:hypothetical protein